MDKSLSEGKSTLLDKSKKLESNDKHKSDQNIITKVSILNFNLKTPQELAKIKTLEKEDE